MAATIEPRPVRLVTDDGVRLEGEVAVPEAAWAAVVLAHPHPLHGGSMRSLVTSELFRTLPEHGLAALRFNFRGVEGSGGTHGGGRDERHDVLAALDSLCVLAPEVPVVQAGWSFGADVSASVVDPRLSGWFLVAPPLRILPLDELVAGGDPRPKLCAVPEHDEFCPPATARERTAAWAATRIEVIAGADHFLAGRTARLADLLVAFARSLPD
ncbi:MAG: hypothetical protein MUF83_05175 [Acidimicrobiales bacterium]|nr:hypothetical protein [Acidimicrobiales bacterium]